MSVHPIEVIPEAASGARRPGATGERALSLDDVPGGADLLYTGEMFFLDYQQPVPVYCWLGNM